MHPTVPFRLSLRSAVAWAMAPIAALSLGCADLSTQGALAGLSAKEVAQLEAVEELDAKAAELEAEIEANLKDAAEALDVDGIRERRLQRVQAVEEERVAPPPATLREALADPLAIARSARALMHRGADGNYEGFRLSAVRPGGLADRLGFQEGDVVLSMADVPLTSIRAATEAAEAAGGADSFEVTFRRGEEVQTVTLVLDAPLPPPRAEELPPPTTVGELLNDPEQLSTVGRALLHRGSDGEYDGYRLSAIRRNSPLDLLGFKNGDVIHVVAGVSLTGMQSAMDAHTAAKSMDTFDVVLTRREQRLTVPVEADARLPMDQLRPSSSTPPVPSDSQRVETRRDERPEHVQAEAPASPSTEPEDSEDSEAFQKRRAVRLERLERLRRLRADRKAAAEEAAGEDAP